MMVGRWTRYPLSFVEQHLRLPGTLGVDTGLGSNGVHIGTSPQKDLGVAVQKDYAASPVYTAYTTEANSAGASDVVCFPASPAQNDAFQIGNTAKWYGADITIGTKAVSCVGTLVWEYYRTTGAWAALNPTLDESSGLMVNGTSTYKLRFVPPTDWAPCLSGVTADTELYYLVRCRFSAFTSISTNPLVSRIYTHTLTDGIGWPCPVSATMKLAKWCAATVSGSTADSVFLLVNLTQGTCGYFTLTKALNVGRDATEIGLGVSEGDEIMVVQVQEDGTTEFANVDLWLSQRV